MGLQESHPSEALGELFKLTFGGLDAWALSLYAYLLLTEYGEINKGDEIIHCFIFYFK